jgi:predicted phosphodiesterase
LIYDVHGNLDALEAVLADAKSAGAKQYLLGGDYCMLGPRPAETAARLDEIGSAIWLRGNTERWVLDSASDDIPIPALVDACEFALQAIGDARAEELADLPDTRDDVRGGFVFCHASPGDDMKGFFSDPVEGEERQLEGVSAGTLVCGHTHQQFRRFAGGVEIVNPGSVGLPFDGDTRAAYGLIADDDSIELRRVEYDVERATSAYGDLSGEWVNLSKRRLRTAEW